MAVITVATLLIWLLSGWFLVGAFRGGGLIQALRRLIGGLLLAGVGLLLVSLLLVLQACETFSGETRMAHVTTRRLSPEVFELTYTPVGDHLTSAVRVELHGDQWSLSGGIVKWHPWLTALGLKSYQRPMRLSGQFSRLAQQRAQAPTVYPLDPARDRVWEILYRASPYLPFIEAVYGSSAYVYVEPNTVQAIYVTPSGYLIKRSR